MIEKNDWRLNGQEKYLSDEELVFLSEYAPYSETWDHEHCAFCWEKPESGSSGYFTKDFYYYICRDCFNDFKEIFNWKVSYK